MHATGTTSALASLGALAGLALVTAPPREARAQDAPAASATDRGRVAARTHFERGVRFAEDGRWPDAIRELEAARDIRATASVMFNLGMAFRAVDRDREAITAFESFLSLGDARAVDGDVARVRGYLDALRASLARVTLSVRPPGAAVTLDGERLHRGPGPAVQALDPGRHLLLAEAAGYRAVSRALELAPSSRVVLDLVLDRVAARPPPSVYAQPWFWVASALVAGGLVTCGVFVAGAVTARPGATGVLGRVTDL